MAVGLVSGIHIENQKNRFVVTHNNHFALCGSTWMFLSILNASLFKRKNNSTNESGYPI